MSGDELNLDDIEARANAAPSGSRCVCSWQMEQARYIATAREDALALVAEVRRLRADNEQGRVNLGHYRETYDALAGENARLHTAVERVEAFAKSHAFSAHALGRTDNERKWLDLLAILERQ